MGYSFALLFALLALASTQVLAGDPSPLQDFCVADLNSNGEKIKQPYIFYLALRIKCLRSDNGGEYSSKEFIKFCAAHGIRMEKTITNTPQ